VPAFPAGSLDLLPRELELHNTFGEFLRFIIAGTSCFFGSMGRIPLDTLQWSFHRTTLWPIAGNTGLML
jgi:hypothetical protein